MPLNKDTDLNLMFILSFDTFTSSLRWERTYEYPNLSQTSTYLFCNYSSTGIQYKNNKLCQEIFFSIFKPGLLSLSLYIYLHIYIVV